MPDPVRTVRVSDEDWNAAQDRAWALRDRTIFADYLRQAVRAFAKNPAAAKLALEAVESGRPTYAPGPEPANDSEE